MLNNMNEAERVDKVIRDNKLSAAEFCRKIGIPKQAVTNWKGGTRPVPEKVFVKIIKAFPDVDARWLITGEEGVNEQKLMEFFVKQLEAKDRIIEKLAELRKELSYEKE